MTITYGTVRAHVAPVPEARTAQAVRFDLQQDAVVSFAAARQGLALHCWSGMAWVTQEGDPTDHVLTAGETFRTDRAGRLVVQAIEAAVVGVSEG